MNIRKRDGSVVPFDINKVGQAVHKAMVAVNGPGEYFDDAESVASVATNASTEHGALTPEDFAASDETITVERLQDEVEKSLMGHEMYDVAKAYILYRQQRSQLRDHMPDQSAIQDYVRTAKYSRYIKSKRRKETKSEIVDRVMTMHNKQFLQLRDQLLDVERAINEDLIRPSMRSMQFAGPAIEKHHAKLYNCSFTHVDRPRVFGEILYLLLCGCGVGFSVQRRHIDRLPKLAIMPEKGVIVQHRKVEDNIIGWADCLNELVQSAIKGVWFEPQYQEIRHEGEPLKTSGGKAPGHVPLRKAIETIRSILLGAQGRQLTDVECSDIICHSAECVLSGGIRRSSLIGIFDHSSTDMFRYKHPDNFRHAYKQDKGLNNHRQMVNISAMIIRDWPKDMRQGILQRIIDDSQKFGDPGFFLADDPDYGTNPCGEIGLEPKLSFYESTPEEWGAFKEWGATEHDIGEDFVMTGFSFCNLSEVNIAKCDSEETFMRAVRCATIIGTVQAAYTNFPYLGPVTEAIARRDALIGVGLTGMCDRPGLAFSPATLRAGAASVLEHNASIAELVGINPARRTTTVKPSGTASLELGCVGSGIHRHHAKRYFRRVTANPNEAVAQIFKSFNPHMVEEKPNGDWCITFAVQAPEGAETLENGTDEDFMNRLFLVYDNWIKPGTRSGTLTHNISSTLAFENLEFVVSVIKDNMHRIGAMSFFPASGDKNIPFIPRETCLPDDIVRWRNIIENYTPVPWATVEYDEDDTGLESACSKEGVCDVNRS